MQHTNGDSTLCEAHDHDRRDEHRKIRHEGPTAIKHRDGLQYSQQTHCEEDEADDEQNSTKKAERNPTPDPTKRRNGLLTDIRPNEVDDLAQRRWGKTGFNVHPFIQPAKTAPLAGYGAS
jgi:hypothetical protein